jgi:hypothetical protein
MKPYKSVNQRIDNGDNKFFKITSTEDTSAVMVYLAEEETTATSYH